VVGVAPFTGRADVGGGGGGGFPPPVEVGCAGAFLGAVRPA
jgi:hypothetical protein